MKKLRVFHNPQIGWSKNFHVDAESVEEGVKIMKVLAEYDMFQYENSIKPDYANANGLLMFDPEDDYDGPEGSWCSWFDEETGIDDPEEWLEVGKERE